jgi:hypothetical protein
MQPNQWCTRHRALRRPSWKLGQGRGLAVTRTGRGACVLCSATADSPPSVPYHSIGMSERYRVPDRLSVRGASMGSLQGEVSIALGRRGVRSSRGSRESMWRPPRLLSARLPGHADGSPGLASPREPRSPAASMCQGDGMEPFGPLRVCGRQRARVPGNSPKRECHPKKVSGNQELSCPRARTSTTMDRQGRTNSDACLVPALYPKRLCGRAGVSGRGFRETRANGECHPKMSFGKTDAVVPAVGFWGHVPTGGF